MFVVYLDYYLKQKNQLNLKENASSEISHKIK